MSLGHLSDSKSSEQCSTAVTELDSLHSTDVPGVLDVKWCDGVYGCQESGLPLFAAADSNGDLSLWSVNRTEMTGEAECHLLEILSAEDGGSLALSVDWSTAVCRRYRSYAACSKKVVVICGLHTQDRGTCRFYSDLQMDLFTYFHGFSGWYLYCFFCPQSDTAYSMRQGTGLHSLLPGFHW